jgi:hypothetical protein
MPPTDKQRIQALQRRLHRLHNEESRRRHGLWLKRVKYALDVLDVLQRMAPSATAREMTITLIRQVGRLAEIEWPKTRVIERGHIVPEDLLGVEDDENRKRTEWKVRNAEGGGVSDYFINPPLKRRTRKS